MGNNATSPVHASPKSSMQARCSPASPAPATRARHTGAPFVSRRRLSRPRRTDEPTTLAASACCPRLRAFLPFAAPCTDAHRQARRAVSGRRSAGCHCTPAGRQGQGCTGHRDRREPSWGRWQSRRRSCREGCRRRQHYRDGCRGNACDQPVALRPRALRPDPRLRAHHAGGACAERARDEQRHGRAAAHQFPAGPDRLRAQEPGCGRN